LQQVAGIVHRAWLWPAGAAVALLVLAVVYLLARSDLDNCNPAPPRAAGDGSMIWDCAPR
jgi:hypothetical protein